MSCAAPGPALALDATAHTFRTLRSFSILLLMEMADEDIVIILDEMVTSLGFSSPNVFKVACCSARCTLQRPFFQNTPLKQRQN